MPSTPEPPNADLPLEPLAEIAVSAMARVDLCRVRGGPHEGVLVAAKRLHDDVADDPEFLKMFRDEVWMASALQHENVVRVLGWGEDPDGPYFATEFVRGVSLSRLMRTVFQTGEVFSERLVVYLASCICKGLAAAHNLRSPTGEMLDLIHRDLTPDNVLVSFQGEVKITDFGLAKAKRRSSRTMTGLVKGTREYMAPEQVRNQPLDARVDLFALGVMLFELFSGQRPWQAKTARETMKRIVEAPPPDLAGLRPGIHSVLKSMVERCLAKDIAARFQTAVELHQQLTQWLQSHGYHENHDHLARFVRRNSMRQMRWCERAIAGEFLEDRPSQPADVSPPRWAEAVRSDVDSPAMEVDDTASATRVEVPKPHSALEPELAELGTAVTDTRPDGQLPDLSEDDTSEDGPTLIQRPEHARLVKQVARAGAAAPGEIPPAESSHTMPSARPPDPGSVPVVTVEEGSAPAMPAPPAPAGAPPPAATPPAPAAATPPAPAAATPPAPAAATPPAATPPAATPPAATPPAATPPAATPPAATPPAAVRPPGQPSIRPSVPPRPKKPPSGTAGTGPEVARITKKARHLLKDASRLASQADAAAVKANKAAERARQAAESAQTAAVTAQSAANAASLAQEALQFAAAGQGAVARERLEQAERLREGSLPQSGSAPGASLPIPLAPAQPPPPVRAEPAAPPPGQPAAAGAQVPASPPPPASTDARAAPATGSQVHGSAQPQQTTPQPVAPGGAAPAKAGALPAVSPPSPKAPRSNET